MFKRSIASTLFAALSCAAASAHSDPAVNDAEIGDWLQQGLGTMPFEQRFTLILAYQMGCALKEMAAITGAPLVPSRLGCYMRARSYVASSCWRDCLGGY